MDKQLMLALVCMSVGAMLAIASLYLLLKQKPVVDQNGNMTEVELPIFGKLKTNYPSLAAFFIAAFLVWYPIYASTKSPKRIPVSGKITLQGKSGGDVIVGIVPGNVVPLNSDGSYKVEVLDGEHTYTGMVYYNGSDTKEVSLGGVSVKDGIGTFDAVIKREVQHVSDAQ